MRFQSLQLCTRVTFYANQNVPLFPLFRNTSGRAVHASSCYCTFRLASPGLLGVQSRFRRVERVDCCSNETSTAQQCSADFSRRNLLSKLQLLALSSSIVFTSLVCQAEELVQYDASKGKDLLTSLAGVGYTVLVVVYFVWVFGRRARRAVTQRGGKAAEEQQPDSGSASEAQTQPAGTSPLSTAFAAVVFAVLSYTLYNTGFGLEAFFADQQLPGNYTARNLTSAVRVTAVGATYLATFIFAANALGLTGLTMKLLLFGDEDPAALAAKKSEDVPLPKVRVTDDIFAIRAAFDEAERQAKARPNADTGVDQEKTKP